MTRDSGVGVPDALVVMVGGVVVPVVDPRTGRVVTGVQVVVMRVGDGLVLHVVIVVVRVREFVR